MHQTHSPEQLFSDHQHLATATLYRTLGQPHAVAKSKSIEYEDLLQVAYIGLWKACQTYNFNKGKFQTYAINHIKWTLIPALSHDFNHFKYPTSYNANNIPEEEYQLASIDADIGVGESRTLHESIAAEDDNSIESEVLHRTELEEVMKTLTERQQKIVELKLLDWTEAEIGKQLGVSKQAINKAFDSIIKKMKKTGEID